MSMPAARDAMSITAADWFVSVEPGIAAGEFGLIRPRFIFRNSVPYFSASIAGAEADVSRPPALGMGPATSIFRTAALRGGLNCIASARALA